MATESVFSTGYQEGLFATKFMGHFPAMLVCAGLISVALASLSQPTAAKRVSRALLYFVLFVVISVAFGWLMYPFSH
jgi:hypothetical protein